MSDIGSPASSLAPPTPSAPQMSDDLFKRPLPIEQAQPLEPDLIGSRTRSKLPLNDTPLEHLELAFIPPDISTDMYDSDCDNDEWRNFLKEYVCPTTHQSAEPGDDEEADPEYNVLEEEEEVDDEELRADRTVQITKKEVSELLSELFEEDFSSSDDEVAPPTNPVPTPRPPIEQQPTTCTDLVVYQPDIGCKTPLKPTGIVQPLTPNPSPDGIAFTVAFPTLNCSPIDIVAPRQSIATVFPDSPLPPVGVALSIESRMLLEEQMRKHVQLLTQMNLITAQQPELTSVTEECRSMLTELVPLSQAFNISNLDEAIHIVDYWDSVVVKTPAETLPKSFQRDVVVDE